MPAGGSYYLEALTDSLAREAWKLLQQIEAAGGFLQYSESGALDRDHRQIARGPRDRPSATRRAAIVGTNQYPNLARAHAARDRAPGSRAARRAHL